MDIKEYRKRVAQRLEEAAGQHSAYGDLVARSKTFADWTGVRSEVREFTSAGAGEASPVPPDLEDQIAVLLEILRNREEAGDLRIAALQEIAARRGDSAELIDLVLALLQDTSEPVVLRHAALALLRQLRFTSANFKSRRPQYLAALRPLVDDPDPELRQRVLEMLAQEKDEYAQRRLLEDLSDRGGALLPPEKEIQLLGYDIHAEYFPVLREIIRNPPSVLAKQEAVRLLSADPASTDLLSMVFRDKEEDQEVRKRSAVALQSVAPAEFEQQARDVVLDEDEDDDFRAACITALGGLGNPAALLEDARFRQRLDQLQKQGGSQSLEHAVQKFKAAQDLE